MAKPNKRQRSSKASARANQKSRQHKTGSAKKKLAPRRVLVAIHGAGNYPEDWHVPLVAAIEKELKHPLDCRPVYFADVGVQRAVLAVDTPEKAQFKIDFQNELEKSFEAAKQNPAIPADRRIRAAALLAPLAGYAATVKAVADYLFSESARNEIQARLIQQLDAAKASGAEIVLIAHSLGTVICFDVLKQLAGRYNIAYWFTTGAPIAKLRRVGRYDDNLGAIVPQNIKRWYNIYDSTDVIADPLGPSFPKPGLRLHDIFVDVGVDPNASHDYLNNLETIQLFADALR